MTNENAQTGLPRTEFVYTLTPEEVERLGRPLRTRKLRWRIGAGAAFAGLVVAGFIAATVYAWNNALGLLPALILTSWGVQVLWLAIEHAAVRRAPQPYADGAPFRVIVGEKGVVEERPLRAITVSWPQVEEIHVAYDFLLFRRQGRAAVFMPLRCLAEGTDPEDFLKACLDAKGRARDTAKIPNVASLPGPRVSFVSRQRDVERLYRHFRRHAGRGAILRERSALLLYLLIAAAFGCHFLALLRGSFWFPMLLPSTVVFALAMSPQISARKEATNALMKTPGMLGTTTVALSPDRIEIIHRGGASLTSWQDVAGVERDRHAIYVRFSGNSLIAIPKTAFTTPAEADTFYAAAMRGWTAAQTGEPAADPEDAVWPPPPRTANE